MIFLEKKAFFKMLAQTRRQFGSQEDGASNHVYGSGRAYETQLGVLLILQSCV
jgi:hypothetical protein